MTIEAQIIEDSICGSARITTMQLRYPRFIHAEFMTHRVFSRNASSSRAIPVAKLIEDVERDPARPIFWGRNQPGMQAGAELEGYDKQTAINIWDNARYLAIDQALKMSQLGAHKQIVNRILEPYSHINVVVTATEWENFFMLRMHEDAQPEIQALATQMWNARENSVPVERENHLPYVTAVERFAYSHEVLVKLSTARCARVSYLTHEGKAPDLHKDLELCARLIGSQPQHYSPAEHPAKFAGCGPMQWFANFKGWQSYRYMLGG